MGLGSASCGSPGRSGAYRNDAFGEGPIGSAPAPRRGAGVRGNDHDRRAICQLATGLRPDFKGSIETRRSPLVLIKNARPEKARTNAEDIAKLVKQETAARDVVAVLAHEDCDATEPAHVAAATKIEGALASAGCPGRPVGVTPAWEIEAWWLVFPEAVAPVVKGWREPNDWVVKDVGKAEHAKEALTRALRPRRIDRKVRDYSEADSIEIARNVVAMELLASFEDDFRRVSGKGVATVRTRSSSFGAFRAKVLALPGLSSGRLADGR
jgi:hypothetical protein